MPSYAVVQIKDTDGKVTFEPMKCDDGIFNKAKELRRAYQAALRSYSSLKGDEKKQATAPVQPLVQQMRGTQMTDQNKVQQLAANMQKKYDQGKEKGKAEDKEKSE